MWNPPLLRCKSPSKCARCFYVPCKDGMSFKISLNFNSGHFRLVSQLIGTFWPDGLMTTLPVLLLKALAMPVTCCSLKMPSGSNLRTSEYSNNGNSRTSYYGVSG